MAIAEIQLPDGRVVEMEVPSGASHDDIMSFAQSQFKPKAPTDSGMAINTVNKTIASIPDQLVNAPGRIANAGIVGYGELSGNPVSSMDDPRLIKDFDPFQKLFNKTEMTRPELEPQTEGQKLASALIAGGTGALMMNPAASIGGNIASAFTGGMSNLASEKAKQATGSDVAALVAGLATGGGIMKAGDTARNIKTGISNKATQLSEALKSAPGKIEDFALNKVNPVINDIAPKVEQGINKTVSTLEKPFTEAGQNESIGDFVYNQINDPQQIQKIIQQLRTPPKNFEGEILTAGEATNHPVIAGLQRNLEKGNVVLDDIKKQQIQSRLKPLDNMILSEEAVDAAKQARRAATKPVYEKIQSQMLPSDQDLEALMERLPSEIKRNATQAAKSRGFVIKEGKHSPETASSTGILGADGAPVLTETQATYPLYSGAYLKEIDKAIKGYTKTNFNEPGKVQSVAELKDSFRGWVNNKTDNALSTADSQFAELSRPINRSQVAQALRDKLSPAMADFGAEYRSNPGMFAKALRDVDNVVSKSTGQRVPITNFMSPEDMDNINGIGKNLAAYDNYMNTGRGVGGSPTNELMDIGKQLEKVGVPASMARLLSAGAETRPLVRVAKKAAEAVYGDVNDEVRQRMARMLANQDDSLATTLEEAAKRRGVKK